MFKLAYISTYPPTHCGVAEYTRFLARSLKTIHPKIGVIVFSDLGEEAGSRSDGEIAVRPAFVSGGSDDYRRLLNELSAVDGVDILHVQHEYGIFGRHDRIIDACLEAREERLAKKLVFTLHTVYHPSTNIPEVLEFQRRLKLVDAIVVHSYLMEFELQNQLIDPKLIRRIPHGTLLNPYLDEDRKTLAESLGLDCEKLKGLILSTVGFLRKDKGLDLLAEAVNGLEHIRENFTLLIAGEKRIMSLEDEKMIREIEEEAEKLNIIFFDKYLSDDEILEITALSDLIILPYKDLIGKYSVSGILHLSMGSFKPIIGTRVPRLLELYQFSPRITVTPTDPKELSRMIRWCMRNYDYVVAYMSSLYSYAVRTQWIRMARRHLSLYRELLIS